jgi:hypothetical protein
MPRIRPREDLSRLWHRLEPTELGTRLVLQELGKSITAVYSLEAGWASMAAYMEDGDAAEIG